MKNKPNQIKIYLTLANESEPTDPIVAHLCRMYYVEKFMNAKKKSGVAYTPEEKKELSDMLTVIETTKKENMRSKEELKQILEDFCSLRFAALNKEEEKAEKITTNHAKLFKSMSNYIDLLSMYDAMTPKWIEICNFFLSIANYCKTKAVNILRCIKQGVEPPRGNPSNPKPAPNPKPVEAASINDFGNPYNANGKIIKGHPKYNEAMIGIEKLMQSALSDIDTDHTNKAKKDLMDALNNLKLLEE